MTSLVRSLYQPSTVERKVKAQFWTVWSDGPTKAEPTFDDYIRVTGDANLAHRASDGSFVAWALNKREAAEKLNYLGHLVLDLAEEILTDDGEKTSEKIKVMGLVNDLIKATAPSKKSELADRHLASMSAEQLDAYIKSLSSAGDS